MFSGEGYVIRLYNFDFLQKGQCAIEFRQSIKWVTIIESDFD